MKAIKQFTDADPRTIHDWPRLMRNRSTGLLFIFIKQPDNRLIGIQPASGNALVKIERQIDLEENYVRVPTNEQIILQNT